MEHSCVTTEEAVQVISDWYLKEREESRFKEQDIQEEKEELRRQQRLLEAKQQEFLRNKEAEEKRQEQEKRLFEMKWKLLEDEWRKLVIERERIERRRSFYERMADYERSERETSDVSVSVLFRGVKDASALKKRYKDLIKIFHPDNAAGDTSVIQKINEEYENLKLRMEKTG